MRIANILLIRRKLTFKQKNHGFADKGELFGWGNSEYGQVPMATNQQQVNMSYALVNFTKGLGKIVDIAAGGSFCLICNGNYKIV